MQSGLSDSLGASFGPLASYALAAVIVLVLILVVLFVVKRMMGGSSVGMNARKGPRLAVIDITAVDQRRKLVLVRRDEFEHLILVGGQNDLLVEGNILRTPNALRQNQLDRAATGRGGADSMAAGLQQLARSPSISPQPRPQQADQGAARSASPLRRAVPRPESRPRPGPVDFAPPASAIVLEGESEEKQPKTLPQPAPTIEPAIVADPVLAPSSFPIRRQQRDPEPILPEREAPPVPSVEPTVLQEEARQAVPPVASPAASAETDEKEPVPPISDAAPVPVDEEKMPEPEQRIPLFLRRTDAPGMPGPAAMEPPPRMPAPAAEPTPGSPVPSVSAPRMEEAGRTVRIEPRIEAAPPIRDEPPTPSEPDRSLVADAVVPSVIEPSEPIPPVEPVPPVEPARSREVPATARSAFPYRTFPPAEARPRQPQPAAETAEEDERRPLSVRSFATVIQSRRQNFEPMRPGPAGDQRSGIMPSEAPAPTRSEQAQGPKAPETSPNPIDDESNLDEVLTRELDSGFGSFDWTGDPRETSRKTAPVPEPKSAPAPPAPPVQAQAPAKPERQLTLEEEMERLLGDFDFSRTRR